MELPEGAGTPAIISSIIIGCHLVRGCINRSDQVPSVMEEETKVARV